MKRHRLNDLMRLLLPTPDQAELDMQAKQEAERRRSEIMVRLRALEMRYEAATRSDPDVD